MRIALASCILILFASSCSDTPHQNSADSLPDSTIIIDTPTADKLPDTPESPICDIRYDTITNPKYSIDKAIMDRYFVPGKRGIWIKDKDTMDTYLHPQDIAVFMNELDSSEQGIYRMLTNRIIFLMLNHDAANLRLVPFGQKRNYFLWHVSHPMCNELPIDSTIAIVEREMQPTESDQADMKNGILQKLSESKQH